MDQDIKIPETHDELNKEELVAVAEKVGAKTEGTKKEIFASIQETVANLAEETEKLIEEEEGEDAGTETEIQEGEPSDETPPTETDEEPETNEENATADDSDEAQGDDNAKNEDAPVDGDDEQQKDVLSELEEDEIIKSKVAKILEFFEADAIVPVDEREDGATIFDVVLFDDADDGKTAFVAETGTLLELFEMAITEPEQAEEDQEYKYLMPKDVDPETMKVRYKRWNRRSVLRALVDFSVAGVDFKRGDVVDWAKLGLHPHAVRRLYNRKVVRHISEDLGILYPFRRKVEAKAKKEETPKETESLNETVQDDNNAVAEENGKPTNFTRAK